MSKNFQPLSSGEVLSVNSDSQIVIGHGTFRVGEFTTALKQLMLEHGVGGITPDNVDWLTADGVDCDVLRFGSEGWVKGKVRLHLEFSEEGDGEASPDPKTEAAIESIAPVAAIASLGSDVESPEALDFGGEFDLADPIDDSPEPPVEAPEAFEKETITAKDTFVQSEEESFDDLFGDEALTEDIDDADDSFDDLFEAEEEVPAEDIVAATPGTTDDEPFDDLFDDSDALFEESVADEPAQEAVDDLDLDLGDDLIIDDDLGFDDEPTEAEAIATDDTPELDDDLDDLFADNPEAELDLDDSDDDLGFDDLVDETAVESPELDAESDDDLGIDDLMLEEDSGADDDLLADPFDELGESDDSTDSDTDFSLEELTNEDGGETEAALDDLSADADTDFSFAELDGDDTDFDLGDLDLDTDDSEQASEEETPVADLEDDALGLGDDEGGDFSFDALADGDDTDFDLDVLGEDDEASSAEETPVAGLEDESLGLGDDESDDFSFDALADGDDIDFDLDGDSPSLDELSAEAGESDFTDDNADFSFTEEESEAVEGMDDLFGDLGESTSESLGDDVADTEASGDEDMSFDNPFEENTDDEDGDLTQDELPPEVDFGTTEDLGEFIDVSMFRKKPAPDPNASADSPFDELAGSEISTDDDEDISLGDLFNENEDEGFNLDELDSGDSDPLDAVTGEEEEVSADIWDLE